MLIKYMGSIINVTEPSNVTLHPNLVVVNPIFKPSQKPEEKVNQKPVIKKVSIKKPEPKKTIQKSVINNGISASAQVKQHVREYLKNNGPSKNTVVLNYVRKNVDCSKFSRNFIYVAVLSMKDVVFTGNRENRIWSLKAS